jgi:hypothetical protein
MTTKPNISRTWIPRAFRFPHRERLAEGYGPQAARHIDCRPPGADGCHESRKPPFQFSDRRANAAARRDEVDSCPAQHIIVIVVLQYGRVQEKHQHQHIKDLLENSHGDVMKGKWSGVSSGFHRCDDAAGDFCRNGKEKEPGKARLRGMR